MAPSKYTWTLKVDLAFICWHIKKNTNNRIRAKTVWLDYRHVCSNLLPNMHLLQRIKDVCPLWSRIKELAIYLRLSCNPFSYRRQSRSLTISDRYENNILSKWRLWEGKGSPKRVSIQLQQKEDEALLSFHPEFDITSRIIVQWI